IDILDLPGVYDLGYGSPESRIVRTALAPGRADAPDRLVVLLDACNLTRTLVLVGELRAAGHHLIVALNMMDLAERRGLSIDVGALSGRLASPVIPIVARTGRGLDALRQA